MTMMNDIVDSLSKRGWWSGYFSGQIIDLASQFGKLVPARNGGPLVDLLRVRDAQDAHPNSLSAHHGKGPFPLHSNGAHHAIVPKYVFLRLASHSPSSRGTVLADFRGALTTEEEECLKRELWIVRTGRRAFLAPVVDGIYLRYDQDVMTPAILRSAQSPHVIRDVCDRAPKEVIRWTHQMTAVIDNHRILHGREGLVLGDLLEENRLLERILVRNNELEN